MLKYPDQTYAGVLAPFAGRNYDADTHNLMREALETAGVISNYDEEIAAFANVGPDVSRIVARQAEQMRAANSVVTPSNAQRR